MENRYKKTLKKEYLIISFILLLFCSLFIGASNITPLDIIRLDSEKIKILMLTRLPRLLSIIVAGVGLSISGVIMQQITSNKFVSPTTAGVGDSTKLGVLVGMLLIPNATSMQKMIVAFIFALIGTSIFMYINKKIKLKNVIFIPLIGMMLGNVIGAITDFFAYKSNMSQSMGAFFQGDFSMVIKGNYELLYISIPLLVIAVFYANKFTIVGMGEDISSNLGINYNVVCNIGMIIVSMISAVVIITVGNIPFVGLIVPNIISIFNGDNVQKNIMSTAIFGAVFLLLCDIIGRVVIYPYEVPIGLTVGVIGSTVFLYLILRRKKNGK